MDSSADCVSFRIKRLEIKPISSESIDINIVISEITVVTNGAGQLTM
ncbi:MAG: hypothetical protein HGB35_04775 [Geobacteraceae bacterium]|nr:hypothetical protein [Geobacteraceae bacterium]